MTMIVYILLYIISIEVGGGQVKNRVKELRARYDWTQEDLAKRMGITRQTVGLIEKGDYSPSILLALRMARVFDVGVDEIFRLEPHEEPEGRTTE